jgi:asparagine synthase (glutamine-hydrolysing)
MTEFPEFHHSVPWFVVLPDCVAGERIAARLAPCATGCVHHASGRPWLVGRWEAEELALAEVGRTRLAVLGDHDATPEELTGQAGRLRDIAELDRLAGRFNGAFSLLASVDGVVRVQGSAFGLRRVLHTRVNGVSVAGDRADVLAALSGSGLDERRLALRLLVGMVPVPLLAAPVWCGVELVPPGHCLVVDHSGRARQRQWWTPPPPVLSLAAGAAEVRKAMEEAVAFRVARGGVLTAELGGVDSTSVCSVAVRAGASVIGYTAGSPDPMDDDVTWGLRTSAALGIEHHVIPHEELPMLAADLLTVRDRFDSPGLGTVDSKKFLAVQERAVEHRPMAHLGGYGGDELFRGLPTYLHGLVARRPLIALRHIRGFRAMHRWPISATLRSLADRRDYRTWLRDIADELTAPLPLPTDRRPPLEWMDEPSRLAPWASADAVAAVREQLRQAAETATPLAPDRGQHATLQMLQTTTEFMRHLDQMCRRLGSRFTTIYYEDKVAAAALSVRPEERVTLWQYKPLLAEAMRGIVPEVSRVRGTKADCSIIVDRGAREHRDNLLAACEDSRLVRLGLVDPVAFREACARPARSPLDTSALAWNLSVEVWLRSLEGTRTHEETPC